jgi:hypothetical protein
VEIQTTDISRTPTCSAEQLAESVEHLAVIANHRFPFGKRITVMYANKPTLFHELVVLVMLVGSCQYLPLSPDLGYIETTAAGAT